VKPVDMIVRHDPPHSVGDCFRAGIASLLELGASDVPHFMEADWGKPKDGPFTWCKSLHDWLKPRGLAYIQIAIDPTIHEQGWFKNVEPDGFSVYHLIGGMSARASHIVVAKNGIMIHDPAPQKDGLIGPDPDGYYYYGFLLPRHGA